jgi:hypothetical protein
MFIDELVAQVSERTGLPADKTRVAVAAVIAQLKAHLPSTMANYLDGLLAGTIPSAGAVGTAADSVAQQPKEGVGRSAR